MTEKEKEKAYNEAIERVKNYYGKRIIKEIFTELKESEDDKIRKEIISILRNAYWTSNKNRFNELVAWLEKQGEQKPCMVQWKGDNLKEVISFTGKDKNFGKWFKSFEEYEKYVHEHNDIFKLFNENGNHYEIPVGAWIVKTPDGYNIASNAVLKQKHADTIEPRFKVGDWVVNKFGDSWHIDSFDKKNYQVSDGKGNYNYFPISKQDEMHIWTIQDAKDGDMLSFYTEYRGNKMLQVGIIKKYVGKRGGCSNTFKMYVGVNWDNNLQIGKYMGCSLNIECSDIHPATKEQHDFLFKKLKESGYKWDAGTKTLEKLEKSSFHKGDWVVRGDTIAQILDIQEQYYIGLDINGKDFVSSRFLNDDKIHLWTIQDAKDGDVLAASECYVVFKEIDGLNIKCYCTYHYLGLNPSFYRDTLQNKDAFLPATKEQRDTFMKVMNDAGYEWDSKKKELKKDKIKENN